MMMRIVITVMMLFIQPLVAAAVSLGRVDVASHLGESFFAEIPLHLDKDESLSSIFVDLASPIEYRFLEVYRDPAVADLRTAIKQDQRGLRVEIISSKALRAPYINLILRVRHGRATHFKKFPIFLSLPATATPKLEQGKPVVTASTAPTPSTKGITTTSVEAPSTTEGTPAKQESFTPFSGWARTNRYGPMVYGDTIFTVARRLRTDKRYTVHQVAIAIFNKNKKKFGKGNINLIKEGSYLDTPTASEVETLSRSEASAAIAAQIKQWKQLTQQPKFARVAEAQKNRYSKRVRVGTKAEGVRQKKTASTAEVATTKPTVTPVRPVAAVTEAGTTPQPAAVSPAVAGKPALSTEAQQRIAQLKADNEILQATVTDNNKRLAELEKQLATSNAAKSNPKIKLLEARLMRIQRQLEQERANNHGDMLLWLIYAAAGIIVLLIVVIGVLLRRQPAHPAQQSTPQQQSQTTPPSDEETTASETKQPEPVTPSATSAAESTAPATEETTGETAEDAAPIAATTADADSADTETSDTETAPDPNVDYLTEADVYMRYGMEDEAEAQVEMALKLDPNNPAAHAKLVEVRVARGNHAEADAAKAAAIALLTGSALATFEQLIDPSANEEDNAENETTDASDESAVADVAPQTADAEPAAESVDEEDLLASLVTPEDDNTSDDNTTTEADDIDALLAMDDTAPAAPIEESDDELQNLLSAVGDSEPESEEDEDVLDLSGSGDDADLESLISSLDSSSDQDTDSDTSVNLDTDEAPIPPVEETAETEISTAAKEEPPVDEEADPSSDENLSGELDFDLSDLDLSKAKVEEPLVNTESVEDDNDLAFDASGIDLSGIVLPGSSSGETQPEPASAPETEQPADAALDIDLDLTLDSATEASVKPEKQAIEADQRDAVASAEEAAATSETGASDLDISLDMDDLDALLAGDETVEKAAEQPQQPEATPDETPQNQSVDEELGALLDGLDDLDLGGDK